MEPVVCELKYSGAVSAALAAAAFATLAILAALPWSLGLKASLALGVCGLALRARREIRDVRRVCLEADGTVTVMSQSGQVLEGRLRDASFVAPWLIIVRWRPVGARFDRTVLIVPGMLPANPARRLRIALRWA